MKKLVAALILFCIVSFYGCQSKTNKAEREIYALDTVITVTAYGQDAEHAVSLASEKIDYYEKLFSTTYKTSEISKLNVQKQLQVSDETKEVINKAIETSVETDGAFDITIYPVVKLWGFTGKSCKVPDNEEISLAMHGVGFEKININENQVTISENTQLDLGAIAKGYIADKITDDFKKLNISGAVLNLGGNVQTYGKKPESGNFTIGLEYPGENSCYGEIKVSEKAVVTSGDYQRFFIYNGKKYHHIFNTKTGYPVENNINSVTIISDSGTLADSLSTALFAMGEDKAVEYYKKNCDFDFIILTKDKKLYATEEIVKNLKIYDEYNFLQICRI